MKTGRTLTELAQELERQVNSRKDYIAPQGRIEAKVIEGEVMLDGVNGEPRAITPFAHKQLADHLSIPARYYDRMKVEQPALLADNLNTWLHADPANQRMVRTLDGKVRAVLSSKYRPLDNYDLASAVIPVLLDRKVQIVSAELTETRMYLKGILPDLSDELPTGMVWGQGHNAVAPVGTRTYGRDGRLVAAITISNSEIGAGALRVEPSVFTTWCTNLAILAQAAMRKYHVGRSFEADEDFSIYRDETRQADDRAFWLKVKDVTESAFNEDTFKAAVAQIRDAAKEEIASTDLPKVVEVAVKQLALPVTSQNSILTALARGGDLTKWGLSSAITEVAGTVDSYEDATELERAGGKVLALDGRAWETIAKAA